jgi:hypothetical protein
MFGIMMATRSPGAMPRLRRQCAGFQGAERLEIAREVRGDVIHLAIGERLLHADESRVVGVVLCHPFKKARDAGAEVRIDLCRNTLRIMRNPRKFWHFSVLLL